MRTDTETHEHIHTDADDRYTHATPIGVCNNVKILILLTVAV